MEPKLSEPNNGPEIPAINYGPNHEQDLQFSSPESALGQASEQFEKRSEAAVLASTSSTLPAPVLPAAVQSAVDDTTTTPVDDMPILANDDDLIEKEWVDKAKKIILETKDDPYRREQEVGKLQAEYLRKRYGRELGAS
jgi:hypothetical protein